MIRDCLTLQSVTELKFRRALVCSFNTRQVRTGSMKGRWYLWLSSPQGKAAHGEVTSMCVVCTGTVLVWKVSAVF